MLRTYLSGIQRVAFTDAIFSRLTQNFQKRDKFHTNNKVFDVKPLVPLLSTSMPIVLATISQTTKEPKI